MATNHCIKKRLIRAAEYVRMSSGKQERSPAQQRSEIAKLAKVEGCEIACKFSDEAISGDSGPEQRPGFGAMLEAAEHKEFEVLLVENGDRIGRFDSIAGAEYYNRLREAGIRIVTCSDGVIDLDSFEGRVVHTVRQEGRHAFLKDLSRKVVRGQVHNALQGNSNGGNPKYGMDRVLVDPTGKIVRRLSPGETVRMPGHRVKHVPSTDKARVAAVKFMFQRYADADVSYRALASELQTHGYPSPRGNGWESGTVRRMLKNPIYRGVTRWGVQSQARYHTNRGEEIVPVDQDGGRSIEDAIEVNGGKGLIDPKLFDQVQRRMTKRHRNRPRTRADFPLAGLLVCQHCGQIMHGNTDSRTDRNGKKAYRYQKYLCATYNRHGNQNDTGCGHFVVPAEAVQNWLIKALQKVFLGPGRDAMVAEIKKQLKAQGKGNRSDTKRLAARVAELDEDIGRLVKAIRSIDAPELVREMADARGERDRLKAELSRIGQHTAPGDAQAEAERIADTMWELGERLSDAEPATLKELFSRMVDRIECRWEQVKLASGRIRNQLIGGQVFLNDQGELSCLFFGGDSAKARA